MKLTISRKSWLLKWAYFLEHTVFYSGEKFSLCPIFWRTILLTPIKLLAICAVAFTVLALPYIKLGWWGIALQAAIVAWVSVIFFVCDRISNRGRGKRKPSIVVAFYRGVKDKYCPLIEVE